MIGRDPMGFADGYNLYQYVSASPLSYRDPLGLRIEIPPLPIPTPVPIAPCGGECGYILITKVGNCLQGPFDKDPGASCIRGCMNALNWCGGAMPSPPVRITVQRCRGLSCPRCKSCRCKDVTSKPVKSSKIRRIRTGNVRACAKPGRTCSGTVSIRYEWSGLIFTGRCKCLSKSKGTPVPDPFVPPPGCAFCKL